MTASCLRVITLNHIGKSKINDYVQQIRRLKTSLGRHGLAGTLRLALLYFVVQPLRNRIRVLRELPFDRRYGINTRGVVRQREAGAFDDARGYQGTSPRLFHDIMSRLGVPPGELTFIDVGCGKGRVLILAAKYGFRRVIGIEISERLCEVARDNLRACGIEAEVQALDATELEFPEGELLLYLYNPFGEATVKAVVDRLRSSLSRKPRFAIIVYVNPVYRRILRESSFDTLAEGRHWVAVRADVLAHDEAQVSADLHV